MHQRPDLIYIYIRLSIRDRNLLPAKLLNPIFILHDALKNPPAHVLPRDGIPHRGRILRAGPHLRDAQPRPVRQQRRAHHHRAPVPVKERFHFLLVGVRVCEHEAVEREDEQRHVAFWGAGEPRRADCEEERLWVWERVRGVQQCRHAGFADCGVGEAWSERVRPECRDSADRG
jgi:hypothetical protein